MELSAALVKELREKTGAGVMECKRALTEVGGDVERASRLLREKGLAQAAKRVGRTTGEGLIGTYVHPGGKIGVLIEVNCETDFVARTEEFQCLVKDLAMQIAAQSPKFLRKEDVPPVVLEDEKKIYRVQALESGKPEKIVDQIAQGKLEKFYSEVCLLEQEFIREPGKRVLEIIQNTIALLKENIQVRRFVRFQIGD